MKKPITLGLVLILTLALATAASFVLAKEGKLELKAGDEVFVCGCGEACPCGSMAMTAGKCTCGKDLVKVKVKSVATDAVTVAVNGKDQTFKTVGKYTCACGEACPCKMVSQNPGKCNCGKDMKEVKM